MRSLALVLGLALAACGVKAPPKPPKPAATNPSPAKSPAPSPAPTETPPSTPPSTSTPKAP